MYLSWIAPNSRCEKLNSSCGDIVCHESPNGKCECRIRNITHKKATLQQYVCSIEYSVNFNLILPNAPTNEPRETIVASFDVSSFSGDILPVSSFTLDDFAFIVKPDFDVASSYSITGNVREIVLPPEAMILVDGNNVNYANGAVDDTLTTNYVFNGQTASFSPTSRPLSTAIQDLINIGVPFQAHNNISLGNLQTLGFRTGDVIAFKIMHVVHGSGFFSMNFSIPQCS